MKTELTLLGIFATLPVRAAIIPDKGGHDAPYEDGSFAASTRLVHYFDFDERGKGNLDDVPKYWEPLRLPGFPHYTRGRFDFGVGAPQPPSFYLASEGRNVAYQYVGPEVRVHPDTAYRIVALIRPHDLDRARACLGAYYSDGLGRAILETMTRSRYVGTMSEADRWARVELYLPPAPRGADRIGLVAEVLQKPFWTDDQTVPWRIPRMDVRGGAWFDSISVYALPQARITTGAPGNVLTGERPMLRFTLGDEEASSVQAHVSIVAADGRTVETRELAVATTPPKSFSLPLADLPSGLYRARLEVRAGATVLTREELTFARLAEFDVGRSSRCDSFGLVLDPTLRSEPETELRLLRNELIRSVKLPLGSSRFPQAMHSEASGGGMERLWRLAEDGLALTAVFDSFPEEANDDDQDRRTPLTSPGAAAKGRSSISDERPRNEPALAPPAGALNNSPSGRDPGVSDRLRRVASYAGLVRWWQVGRDGDCGFGNGGGRVSLASRRAFQTFNDAMQPLLTDPHLVFPLCLEYADTADFRAARQVALSLPAGVDAARVGERLGQLKQQGFERVSAYVSPLPLELYQRGPRLAEWAQRVVTARHGGADTVFVPQPWTVRETSGGFVTEPLETYVVLRTLAALLGDAEPGPSVPLDEGVTALAFYKGDSAVLALWENNSPPGGRARAVQLGRAQEVYDAWGRRHALSRDARGRQRIHLSPMPVLIPGVERWLIDLRTAIKLVPSHADSGAQLFRPQLRIAYSGARPMTARIRIDGPTNWRITPRVLDVALAPGETISPSVEVRYPHNEPAGKKALVARMEVAGPAYELDVPIPIDVGLSGLAVSAFAAMEGTEAVLRQFVTNETGKTLSLRGFAVVPGRERRHRPMPLLGPGDTEIVEYRFDEAEELIGRTVRLVLRGADDGLLIHTLELSVP